MPDDPLGDGGAVDDGRLDEHDVAEARRWASSLVRARIGEQLGEIVTVHGEPAGTAPGLRMLVEVAGVGPVFVKAGDGTLADEAVGSEIALIMQVRSRHMPHVLAHDLDGEVPWMVQPSLADGQWPAPWPTNMRRVYKALRTLSRSSPPPWLPKPSDVDPWLELLALQADDTQGWWRPHAEMLADAAARVSIEGDALVHGDLGSGNLCIREGTVLVIDWSDAMVANPAIDVMSVAVDRAHHDDVRDLPPVRDPQAWLAKTAGLLLSASLRPAWPTPGGPQVRAEQAAMARTAVGWAAAVR